jgi:hypothetical protein
MRIIKSKKTGYQILCLNYDEWNMFIKNKFKEIRKSSCNYNVIIDYIVCSLTDFLIDKGCIEIKYQSKDSKNNKIKTYKEMREAVKNELYNFGVYKGSKI